MPSPATPSTSRTPGQRGTAPSMARPETAPAATSCGSSWSPTTPWCRSPATVRSPVRTRRPRRLWIDPLAPDSERACCSPQSVRAARSACHAAGVPHVTLDLRRRFHTRIVAPFVREHAAGETPNPCVRCNGSFRFDALAEFADTIGAPRIATGHYARIVERDGRVLVARGADPDKDQSYMLARVEEEILRRVWFPLGEQRKQVTREQARGAGLAAAGRAESQEVCFVGGGDHRSFVERHGGAGRSGEIVSADGRVLGRHQGVHRFTPGQRRGLGVGGGEALFVISTDADSGRVVAGPRSA